MAFHTMTESNKKPKFPQAGDWVEILKMPGARGQVMDVDRRRKRARVRVRDQEWVLPLRRLTPGEPPDPADLPSGSSHVYTTGPTPYEIDLHGMRVEDAIAGAEKALDQALVAGQSRLKIIHGFGAGRVRKAIREMLTNHPNVKDFHFGDPIEGGLACTIAELHYPR